MTRRMKEMGFVRIFRKILGLTLLILVFGVPASFAEPIHGHPQRKLSDLGLLPEEIISMGEFSRKIKSQDHLVIFDARGSRSYQAGHIRGAVLPLSEEYYREEALFQSGIIKKLPDRDAVLAEQVKKYSKDQPIVTYCSDGCQASVVLFFSLKKLGFKEVQVMDGGFESWRANKFPVDAPI